MRKLKVIFILLALNTAVSVTALVAAPVDLAGKPGILVRGPVRAVGFPQIYPNALETWIGYYRYLDSEIVVYFTWEFMLVPSEWTAADCGKLKGFSPGRKSLLYRENDWTVLFSFAELTDCSFIEKYVERLKYFLRNIKSSEKPLFPAILEFKPSS